MVAKLLLGIKLTRLKTQGWWASSTTTIAFEDVKVPVENRIGEGGEGFIAIMRNFNKERRTMAVYANRFSRNGVPCEKRFNSSRFLKLSPDCSVCIPMMVL